MSWHFSQALVEAFSADTCSDGKQCVLSSTTPTPAAYYWPDKTTEHSRLSRFGMTSEPLTATPGEELLTWYRAAFPARTSAQLEKVPAWTESAAVYGPKWHGSFARFDHDSYSWKTVQCSLLGDLESFSETWPRWGLMHAGVSSLQQTPELPICAIGSGLWPTPCASDNSNRQVSETVHITANGLPKHVAPNGEMSQMRLSQAVKMWPTPTVCGNYNRKGASKTSGDGLATAVRLWRTPNASDANKWSKQSLEERLAKGQQVRLNTQVSPDGSQAGQLNPDWVEWLMGWPIGWTDLKPLATAKFREWQQQHGAY